jgi:hypothetical protein
LGDEKQLNRWLKLGDVKEDSEGTVTAGQYHSVSTDYLKTEHFKEGIESKFGLWKEYGETVDPSTSRCHIKRSRNK